MTTTTPIALPEEITRHTGGLQLDAVASSATGTRVRPLGIPPRFYLKWGPVDGPNPVRDDAERLAWLHDSNLPCPEVVAFTESDGTGFLLMTALPGKTAADTGSAIAEPSMLGRLASLVHRLHAHPTAHCPFKAGSQDRIAWAKRRLESGQVDATAFDAERQGADATALLAELLATRPEQEDGVIVHGDMTLDNIMVEAGWPVGLVDVGRLGISDRHCDLALLHRSLAHRVSPEAAELFLDLYGRAHVDADRLAWYRLLDEFF